MKDKHGLLSKPISQVLLHMSLPNVFGILTVLIASLIDTYFISKLGTNALTAISFTFSITLVISSIAMGIGTSVSTNFGRFIGSGETAKAKLFLHDALIVTFLLITAVGLIGRSTIEPLFSLLGASKQSLLLIHDYMSIWFISAPILVLMMVSNQALRATGDARSPAKIMAIAAVLNIIFDPLLIFGIGPFPRLELQGAAIATIIAWSVALFISFYLLAVKRQILVFAGFCFTRIRENVKQLAIIAQPAAVMNLINPLFNAILMAILARIDYFAVAAFGAGTRVESILLIVTLALSSSLVPFIAQNLGAGQTKRAHNALMLSLKFIVIFQTVLFVPTALFAQNIAMLFSSDEQVIYWLTFYIQVIPLAYGPLAIVIMVATVLNAYQRPIASLTLNVCRLFVVMLPMALVGAHVAGVKGLLLAIPIANILMGIGCYFLAGRITESDKMQHSASLTKV